MGTPAYDPFIPGPFPVGVRTIQAYDPARDRLFPCELWYPARVDTGPSTTDEQRGAELAPGPHPLIVYSHGSGMHRRSATFLCTHLASHGYVVAAMDHSETVAHELQPTEGATPAQRAARIDAIISSRVPDLRFLLDHLLVQDTPGLAIDAGHVGLVGYSFGGWTVLAATQVEPQVRSVVAMGPGGSSNPRPGILPLTLTFDWTRPIPTLFLAAENDTAIPLDGVIEIFDRTPGPKRLMILRRADHQHFLDDVEREHEAVRTMDLPPEAAWMAAEMRPIAELSSGEQAHLFTRGLTLAHLDVTLRGLDAADRFLAGDLEAELARRGVDCIAYRP